MMKKTLVAAAILGMGVAGSASAASLDFADLAQNGGPSGAEGSVNGVALTVDGVGLTATSYKVLATNATPVMSDLIKYGGAYLDSYSGGKPGGMGVCGGPTIGLSFVAGGTSTRSNQCGSGADDDNVSGARVGLAGYDEVLEIDFDVAQKVTDFTFFNADHGTSFSGKIDIAFGDPLSATSWETFDLANFLDITDIVADSIYFRYTGEQFYVSAITVTGVPVPAAGVLLLAGLGGLGLMGAARRKK